MNVFVSSLCCHHRKKQSKPGNPGFVMFTDFGCVPQMISKLTWVLFLASSGHHFECLVVAVKKGDEWEYNTSALTAQPVMLWLSVHWIVIALYSFWPLTLAGLWLPSSVVRTHVQLYYLKNFTLSFPRKIH